MEPRMINATDPNFLILHISAITTLSISIIVSFGTLLYLCLERPPGSFFNRRRGERLVVYLAIADLLFSCEHIVDHTYAVVTSDILDGVLCVVSGFFLQEFATAQGIIVLITAFTSYMLIRHEIKIGFGRYDCGILILSFGIPTIIGTLLACLGLLGPSDYWCLANMKDPNGYIVDNIFTSIGLLVVISTIFFYLSTWQRMKRVSSRLKLHQTNRQADKRSAFFMMAIVAAYLTQWWAYMVYSIWNIFEPPHIAIVICATIFTNLGGLFNFLAYTFIRRHYRTISKALSASTTSINIYLRSISTVTVMSTLGSSDSRKYDKSASLDDINETASVASGYI